MLDAVKRFAGDFEQRDDIALLAIRFKGGRKMLQNNAETEQEPETEVEPEVQPVVEPQQPEPEVFEAPQPIEEPKVYDEPEITIEDAEATEIL
jgi:outer membrane biosynthesis protein TonB